MHTDALRAGFKELGYVEGKNIVLEYGWAEGKLDRLPALAVELVRNRAPAHLIPRADRVIE